MISRSRWLCAVPVVVECLCSVSAFSQDRADEEARAAIRAMIDKVNLAWKPEGDASLLREVLSDKAFAVVFPRPGNPSEAIIHNKQTFCEWVEKILQERRLRKRQHRIKSVTVSGPLAYELGTSVSATAEGQERQFEILNFFAKDETGWKLVFSASADQVRKALRDDSADEQTLRKLAREFVDTFRTDHATPFKRLEDIMADDIVAILSSGRMLEGKRTLLNFYKESLTEILAEFRTFKIVYDIRSVRLLGDAATVFGKLRVGGQLKENNERWGHEVWETLVFRKDAGGWRLVQEHSTKAASENPPSGEQ